MLVTLIKVYLYIQLKKICILVLEREVYIKFNYLIIVMKNDDLINKKNGKRGFTLIELMAILIILALIVMLSSTVINNIFDDVEKRVDKTTKNVIISAANDYVLEYRKKNDWKENVANNGDITFCVSMNSLLDTGYYDYDD